MQTDLPPEKGQTRQGRQWRGEGQRVVRARARRLSASVLFRPRRNAVNTAQQIGFGLLYPAVLQKRVVVSVRFARTTKALLVP